MKKILMVVTVAVAAIFIAGTVLAWGGCGAGPGKGGKDCPNKEEMKKALGITPEQDKLLEAERTKHREESKALYDAIKAKKKELSDAIAKPGATRAGVQPIVDQLKVIQDKKMDKKVDGIFAMKAILTPEQFAKLEQMKEKGMMEGKGKRNYRGR